MEQNRNPRNKPTPLQSINRGRKHLQWVKDSPSMNGVGKLDRQMQKNKTIPPSYVTHSKFKMDQRRTCQTRNHKDPRVLGSKISDIARSKSFSDLSSQARETNKQTKTNGTPSN